MQAHRRSAVARIVRLHLALSIAIATLGSAAAASPDETFPTRPIRIVVFVATGGSADAVARMLGEGLQHRLGQSVIVENKPGAGGNLATQTVAHSAPDGYTLLLTANNHTINPSLFAGPGYELGDFVTVAPLMEGPSVIAVPVNSSFHTLGDLLAEARRQPGAIAFGSAGIGTPSHIAGELLQREAGVSLNHIAYRGSGPSITDAMGGQIPVVIASLVAAMPQIEGGKLRALAVTSRARWPSVPDIPAASESGIPNYEHITWLGLFAPRAVPPAVLARLTEAVRATMQQPGIRDRVVKLGGGVPVTDRATFEVALQKEFVASRQLVRDLKLRAD